MRLFDYIFNNRPINLSENMRNQCSVIQPLSVAVPSLDARCQCAANFNTAFDQLCDASDALICEPTAAATFEQIQVCLFFQH